MDTDAIDRRADELYAQHIETSEHLPFQGCAPGTVEWEEAVAQASRQIALGDAELVNGHANPREATVWHDMVEDDEFPDSAAHYQQVIARVNERGY